VVDILDRQVELVLVPLRVAAVFAAAVGQHPAERDAVLLVKRQHPVIEQIGRRDRRLDIPRVAAPPRPRTGSKLAKPTLA
jgi:hypothetical protein